MPIRVSIRAVFSKYAITPARGINFGPHTYGTTSKPRVFEIFNMGACLQKMTFGCLLRGWFDALLHCTYVFNVQQTLACTSCLASTGDFPFNYRLFNFANPPPTKLSTAAPPDPKDKKVRFDHELTLHPTVCTMGVWHAILYHYFVSPSASSAALSHQALQIAICALHSFLDPSHSVVLLSSGKATTTTPCQAHQRQQRCTRGQSVFCRASRRVRATWQQGGAVCHVQG